MEKTLQCPRIFENHKQVGYGGNQEWFSDAWARKAGCASVSANDIYNYYTSHEVEHEKQVYLKAMEDMFSIMTPKKMGFPYAYLYARRVFSRLKEKGIMVRYKIHRNPDTNTTIKLVKESLGNGNPVGLLILKHRRWQMRHDVWHWVTIFGYRDTKKGPLIIVSDCGEKKEILARIVFETHRLNYFKMVVFDKQ